MNCFAESFANRKTFIAYITAGHRGLDYTYDAACALVAGGVDILEIGIPFSDPVADGPVIQEAMTDALTYNYNFADILKTISKIKKQTSVPIVLFSYLNPLLNNGFKDNLQQAKEHGVDGVLIVDLPLEFSNEYFTVCQELELMPVSLLANTTADLRVKEINSHCNSFLYYVCRSGTTGVKSALPDDFAAKMTHLKEITTTPVVCGFGIGNRDSARSALAHADGFVVGSAIVKAISEGATSEQLTKLAKEIDPRG